MTNRIFRAVGTLAAALVFLAGCDSAESDGLSPTANSELPPIPFVNEAGCYRGAYPDTPDGFTYFSTFSATGSDRYLRLRAYRTGTNTGYRFEVTTNIGGSSATRYADQTTPTIFVSRTITAGSPLTVQAVQQFINNGGTYSGLVEFAILPAQNSINPCDPVSEG